MIIFIRDNECFEPRVQNYLKYYKNEDIPYHVIAWNRSGKKTEDCSIDYFEHRAEYGKRAGNIANKIRWMLYVMKMIYRYRKECTLIHACDIDGIIPALVCGKLFGIKPVFDIFDWNSSLTGIHILDCFMEYIQNFCYKHSSAVILCEKERIKQAKTQNAHTLILPNIPNDITEFDSATDEKINKYRKKYKITISYVGVFDRDRGLENLLSAVSKSEDVLLNIAGFGVLDDYIRNYAENNTNIIYWGRVEYAVGQSIMKNSDIIAAMYYLTSPLHKYAAPNKYYESLILGIPVITTKHTLVGSKVEEYNTGFVLDETEKAILDLLHSEDLKVKICQMSDNCHHIWRTIYKDYYSDFMQNQYLPMLNTE